MNKLGFALISLMMTGGASAQRVLSIDSCEQLALQNNKEEKIAQAEADQASYEKKSAFGQYFPSISIKGAYFRNQKEISLLGEDAMLPIGSVMADGSFGFALPQPVGVDENGRPILQSSQINNKWIATGDPQEPVRPRRRQRQAVRP